MNISIVEALKPFSHTPGSTWILPHTSYKVEVFPCLIRVFDWERSPFALLIELRFFFEGPLEEFTVSSDLEKGKLVVWGRSKEGFIRYTLAAAQEGGFYVCFEKTPAEGVFFQAGEIKGRLHSKERAFFLTGSSKSMVTVDSTSVGFEKLFLGSHKAQEIEMIRRRGDLREILPLIHRLGQLVPNIPSSSHLKGSFELLNSCDPTFSNTPVEEIEKKWKLFCLAAFDSSLVPQLEDIFYQGIVKSVWLEEEKPSPLALLVSAARLVRKLFVREEEAEIALLPTLLPSLHCGKMTNVCCRGEIWLSLEWTKKSVRRVLVKAKRDLECLFSFQSSLKSFRFLLLDKKQQAHRIACGAPLRLKADRSYLLDCFE